MEFSAEIVECFIKNHAPTRRFDDDEYVAVCVAILDRLIELGSFLDYEGSPELAESLAEVLAVYASAHTEPPLNIGLADGYRMRQWLASGGQSDLAPLP